MTQHNIVATVFGGVGDNNISAYSGKRLDDTQLYVALPSRFEGSRPAVKVTNVKTGKFSLASIEDVGPWNTEDAYWEKNARPQAESGHDTRGRQTNHAGIDLSPALARAIGIDGMGYVDWKFLGQARSDDVSV